MLSRQTKVDLLVIALWCLVLVHEMDKERGFHSAARIVRWYGSRCRDLGNWAWTQALAADNAYKELMHP